MIDFLCGGCDKIWTLDDEGDVTGKFTHIVAGQSAVMPTGEELIVYPGEEPPSNELKYFCNCGELIVHVRRTSKGIKLIR